jgi:hypothetical protein
MRSVSGLPRKAARSMKIQDAQTQVQLEPGQRILCNLVSFLHVSLFFAI